MNWLALGSPPPPSATLLPRCRTLSWRTGRCPTAPTATGPRPASLPLLRLIPLLQTSQRPGPGRMCSTPPAGMTGKAPPSCAPLVGPAKARALAAPASSPSLGSVRNWPAALARPPPPLPPLPPPPPPLPLPPPHPLLPGTASKCGSHWMGRTNSPLLPMCARSKRPASSCALVQSRTHPVLLPPLLGHGVPRAQR